MCTRKQLGLAVLLAALAGLLAAAPAVSKNSKDNTSKLSGASCTLAPTGVEPDASGRAKLSNVQIYYPDCGWPGGDNCWPVSWGLMNVVGRGLTPGETYSVECTDSYYGTLALGSGNADDKGVLDLRKDMTTPTGPLVVTIVNGEGATVLEGTLPFEL